jgi:hypothetical protein
LLIFRSGNGEGVVPSVEDTNVMYFSYFENYCRGKPWLFYMYCVFQQYDLLACAARDLPAGTGASSSETGPPTSTPHHAKKKGSGGGGGGGGGDGDARSVVVVKSAEGKKLEKFKRKHAECVAVGARTQVARDLDNEITVLDAEIKEIVRSGGEVPEFKSRRMRMMVKDISKVLKDSSESESEAEDEGDSDGTGADGN